MICPTCGLDTRELRCPRCFSLVLAGCAGSCLGCSLCGVDKDSPGSRGACGGLIPLWKTVKTALRQSAGQPRS